MSARGGPLAMRVDDVYVRRFTKATQHNEVFVTGCKECVSAVYMDVVWE